MNQSSTPLPFSLRKHLADVGHLDDLSDEAREELAAILVAIDDSPLRLSLSIDPDALLRECMEAERDPFAQWIHELTVDAGLRQEVRECLPRRLVEVHTEMHARLIRHQPGI